MLMFGCSGSKLPSLRGLFISQQRTLSNVRRARKWDLSRVENMFRFSEPTNSGRGGSCQRTSILKCSTRDQANHGSYVSLKSYSNVQAASPSAPIPNHGLGSKILPSRSKLQTEGPSEASEKAWVSRKASIKSKYPEGWQPSRRISPEAMQGIRIFHKQVLSRSQRY